MQSYPFGRRKHCAAMFYRAQQSCHASGLTAHSAQEVQSAASTASASPRLRAHREEANFANTRNRIAPTSTTETRELRASAGWRRRCSCRCSCCPAQLPPRAAAATSPSFWEATTSRHWGARGTRLTRRPCCCWAWSAPWQRARSCASRRPSRCASPSPGTTPTSRRRTIAATATHIPTRNGPRSRSRRLTAAAATTCLRGLPAATIPHRCRRHPRRPLRSSAAPTLTAPGTMASVPAAAASATLVGAEPCAPRWSSSRRPAASPTQIRSGRGEALRSWKPPAAAAIALGKLSIICSPRV